MWKHVLLILVIVAAVLAALLAAAGYFIFRYLFHRPRRSAKVPKFYQDSPHFKASRAGMELMKSIPCRDVYLTSRDGLKLHAYLFSDTPHPEKIILAIHGYKSYARPEYGPYIAFYRSLGYSMLIPDDRAHAPSEGTYIGFGVLDRLDCVDWARYLVQEYGSSCRILLHGVSMGAATVLAASGEADLPSQVQGIVADCGYSSAREILAFQFRQTARLPAFPLLNLCQFFCRRLAGYGFREHTPLEQVTRSKTPTLIIHGTEDSMVPVAMASRLYEACAARKKLLIVPGAGHAESVITAPDACHQAIRDFFGI